MAYTTYPAESVAFNAEANTLRESIQKTSDELVEINSIFKVDTNEDYLTLKTIEATDKIKDIVKDGVSAIELDMVAVKIKADELENKERERQEALKRQQEQEDNSND